MGIAEVSMKRTAFVRQELCRGCGLCTTVCPTGAIELRSGKAMVSQDRCRGCLACAGSCPAGAIGYMPLDSLMDTARRIGRLQEDTRRLSLQVERLHALRQAGECS
jgi:Fe-S-cluster-containing hydrogenase component 2